MLRPPLDLPSFEKKLRSIYSPVEAEQWLHWTLRLPPWNLSATAIREHLRRGEYEKLKDAIDPAVLEYIRANHLYR